METNQINNTAVENATDNTVAPVAPETAVAAPVKVRKPGSGRKAGSVANVNMTLAQLVATFADQSTPIPVSRKWALALGFTGTTPVVATETAVAKVDVKVEELD